MKLRWYTFDTLGSEEIGWEVNDVWRSAWVVTVNEDPDEEDIMRVLRNEDDAEKYGIEYQSDDIWLVSRENGKPIGEFRREDE